MRVLHVYDSPYGGGATVAAESVIACQDARSTYVLRPNPLSWERQAFRACGFCDPAVVRGVRCKIRLTACDVVHLHSFKEFGVAAIKAAKLEGKRVVWSCYDYNCLCPRDTGYGCCDLRVDASCWRTWQPVKRRPVSLLAKLPLVGRRRRIMRWLNELDAVVCLSRHSEGLLRAHGLTVPVYVVPLPITVPELMVWQGYLGGGVVRQLRASNTVLYLGGDRPHKGAQVIAEAMRIVRRERPGTVLMTRGGSRNDALRQIASSACLVVPEQWPNPGPVVIVEAQLLGTPVVASCIGGIPELGRLRLCPPTSPGAFASAIIDVLSRPLTGDPDEYFVPTATLNCARQRHDPTRVRAQLEEAYGCYSGC